MRRGGFDFIQIDFGNENLVGEADHKIGEHENPAEHLLGERVKNIAWAYRNRRWFHGFFCGLFRSGILFWHA